MKKWNTRYEIGSIYSEGVELKVELQGLFSVTEILHVRWRGVNENPGEQNMDH